MISVLAGCDGLSFQTGNKTDELIENRFRFLVQWDPSALVHPDIYGYSPIHYAACDLYSIQGFQLVFEYGVCYYPKKKGINLLFLKGSNVTPPFERACNRYGNEQVMKLIEDTLIRYSDTTPVNVEEALLSTAIDENVHLDCVYFLLRLLRREPDVLLKLLSQASPPTKSAPALMGDSNNDCNSSKK